MSDAENWRTGMLLRTAGPSRPGSAGARIRSENLDEILTEACGLVGEALGPDSPRSWNFKTTA